MLSHSNHFPVPDGIDGKQARRTQSSTPLGELFDHGLDSWTSFFIPAVLYSVFGRVEYTISPLRLYFCLMVVLITFLSSHWEKYNTGILYLPWGYDVSQLVMKFSWNLTSKFSSTIISSGRLFNICCYIRGWLWILEVCPSWGHYGRSWIWDNHVVRLSSNKSSSFFVEHISVSGQISCNSSDILILKRTSADWT